MDNGRRSVYIWFRWFGNSQAWNEYDLVPNLKSVNLKLQQRFIQWYSWRPLSMPVRPFLTGRLCR